jgi:hypothetical protein
MLFTTSRTLQTAASCVSLSLAGFSFGQPDNPSTVSSKDVSTVPVDTLNPAQTEGDWKAFLSQAHLSRLNEKVIDQDSFSLDSPILEYDQIREARSGRELYETYAKSGVTFSDPDLFLIQAQNDWLYGCYVFGTLSSIDRLNSPPELYTKVVEGCTYRILGVVHDAAMGEKYLRQISDQFSPQENWLHEFRLQSIFNLQNSYEIPDEEIYFRAPAIPAFDQFLAGAATSTFGIFRDREALLHTRDTERRSALTFPGGAGLFLKGMEDKPGTHDQKWAICPEAIHTSGCLPFYLTVEVQTALHEAPSYKQLRSALMAEVLRRWNVTGDKRLLTGRGHAAEVLYYLEHPATDPALLELAHEQAAAINRGEQPNFFEHAGLFSGAAAIGFATPPLLVVAAGIALRKQIWKLLRRVAGTSVSRGGKRTSADTSP